MNSLVTCKQGNLDLIPIVRSLLDDIDNICVKSSLLARQPGFSLTWLGKNSRIDELDPFFKMLDKKSMREVYTLSEEDKGLYHAVKQTFIDPLSVEMALKADRINLDTLELKKDLLKNFFFLDEGTI